MDDSVIRSMLKWPDVPDVYGWLRLDRRGNWRLRSEGDAGPVFTIVGNAAFNAFISRNYGKDERGCWFFQNGPQRVFVGLDYAPLVYRVAGSELVDHCGRPARQVQAAWLDEEGSLVLQATGGPGGLDDRDLGPLADSLSQGSFEAVGASLPLGRLRHAEMESRFGFVREPKP
jgi:hypothetical protein